jgi:GPH family glycoside/pentoside/hexuronide:cation symporter
VYFLYFLTDVVGLPAFYGGMISLIVVLWDAITDPIVGFLSDNCKSKHGRRRPFMLGSLIPLGIVMVLLFTAVDFTPTAAFIYYVVIGVLYWTAYTVFVIPYYALGAEITSDFDQRTNVRGAAGIVMYLAMWMVSAGPMVVLDRMIDQGHTEAKSWFVSGILLGIISILGGLYCWWGTKGKELVNTTDFKFESHAKILANYTELFKLKAIRRFLLMTLIYNVAFSIALAAFVFIMDNNLGLSPAKQAFYWTCYSALTLAFVPICNIIAIKIGKKMAMISLTGLAILGCFIYFINGIHSFTDLIIFTILYNLGNVCYWTVGYSLMYDCTEIDEYANDKRREGAITGFSSFMQKFGSAAGMYIAGGLLTLFGYDGNAVEQTDTALRGIITINTFVPGVLMILGTIFIILYPITKDRHAKLLVALRNRKSGLPFEEDEDFKKLF